MKLLNKVKDELQQKNGYDFGSEFWTDEMLSVAYDLVYTTEKILNEKVEAPKKESTTKFIKLPSHVQEMIEAETVEITKFIESKTGVISFSHGPVYYKKEDFVLQLKEAKATAYFREMELIEQITELRKQNENK